MLTGGSKGKRFALANSRIMIHQPSSGIGGKGQASDLVILANEIARVKSQLNGMYALHTGQPVDVVEKAMERDCWMDAQEAISFGLIDSVLEARPKKITTEGTA